MAEHVAIHLPQEAFTPKFYPLLREEDHRYLVLYGGAGSGKSVFAAQRFLYRLLSRPLCNLLVVRAVAATHRDSTYALFRQIMAQWGVSQLFTCRETDLRITCKNGNMAVFKGLDDREKLKSITFPKGELTDIWVEEASQISQADFNQLDVRLRGRAAPKQMVLTFNPISAQHWLKARFFDQLDPRALVVKSTYRDNPFLDEAYRQTLESYRDTDPYYYAVYCLGEWGVLGQSIFDGKRLTQRLGELPGPVRQGEFTWQEPPGRPGHIAGESIRFLESPQGLTKIYREPCPGRSYVVGGDTAGEGSDFNVAQVLDRETGEQVCTLRGPMDEDLFARQLYCLGLYYNTALLAVEVNFSTYPVRELERLGYPRQYRRMGEDGLTGRPRQSWGFRTTSATRPLLIAGLVELARDCPQRLNDRETIQEMLRFVRSDRGRPQAQQGAHDDCVMALGIAWYAKDQEPLFPEELPALTVPRYS